MQVAADVGWGSQVDILSVAGKVYVAYTDASGYLCVLQVSAEKCAADIPLSDSNLSSENGIAV